MNDEESGAYVVPEEAKLVLGTAFLNGLGNPPGKLIHVAAVLTHEAAHNAQAEYDLLDILINGDPDCVKCIELHADYLAGAQPGAVGSAEALSLGWPNSSITWGT